MTSADRMSASAVALLKRMIPPAGCSEYTASTCSLPPPPSRSLGSYGLKRNTKLFGRRAWLLTAPVAPPTSSTIHRLPSRSAWMPS